MPDNFAKSLLFSMGLVALVLIGLTGHKLSKAQADEKSLEQQVQELQDREAIRQLPITYVQYIRARNYDGLASIFARNGGFHSVRADGEKTGAVGTKAIRDYYEKSVPLSDPWAFVHNQSVELLGNGKARGKVMSEIRRGTDKMKQMGIAVYEDSYVKEDGVWKFQDRQMKVVPIPAE